MAGDDDHHLRSDALGTDDAVGLAERVARGEVTPSELLEAAMHRAEALNPALNAIVRPMHDEARRRVRDGLPDGPLRGVPFLIKDIGANYAGFPTSAGSRLYAHEIKPADSELVRRLKAAGLVIFGKTNTPEFGSLGTTEPLLFGPTRNPWNLDRSPGGSSGGAAAAVAAGIVPAAQGCDGAGSIRIPASCCGVVGLKATRARITLGPDVGESPAGITVPGFVTRTVRDAAAMLDVSAGPMPGDPYVAPPPARPYLEEVTTPPGRRLRIALTDRSLIGTALHPDCAAAARDAGELCAGLGHEVVEDAPPLDGETYHTFYRRFWLLIAGRQVHRANRARGGNGGAEAEVEPFNRYCYEEGLKIRAHDYLSDVEWFHGMGRAFARWMIEGGYDVWLTPTLGAPPPPLGHFDARRWGGATVLDRFVEFLPFTPLCNMTGQPAISLPLYRNGDGLPVGTQFAGPYGDEATLLRLAAQLEQVRPWPQPPLPLGGGSGTGS